MTVPQQPAYERIFGVRREELVAVAWSFVYFFCVLSSYYMLRSVRETMAVEVGFRSIPWLFSGTFLTMLVIAPVFGLLASRIPRKTLLPWVYVFFVANILIFRVLFWMFPEGAQTTEGVEAFKRVGVGFFIWLSVFNLFVVSVFWSFMADIYTKSQSRRLFGFISAGGSAGAIIGPFFASRMVIPIGFENMLPISACILLVAVVCIGRLKDWVVSEHSRNVDDTVASDHSLGGTWWNGILSVFRERYLVWMACGSVIASLMGTALYLFTAELVTEAIPTTDARVQFFATIDWITNSVAFLFQLLVVRHSVERLGLGITLMIMPVVSIIGFILLASHPLLLIVAILTIARRAIGFGLTKPTSDMLYSVVPDDQKYKSKNFIDTAVYRGGDLFGAWTVRGLQTVGLGIAGIALVMVPVGLIWVALAFSLGREYKRRDADSGATHVR